MTTPKIKLCAVAALYAGVGLAAGIAASDADNAEPHKIRDERLYQLARTDPKAFAHEVTQGANSDLEKSRAIVRWITQNLDWKTTDYRKRTVADIVERGGGNCDDFSSVAVAAMKELNLQSRKVHEIHIRTESPGRGERARALVKEKGNAYSVFGRRHNDHVWLEVYDTAGGEWFPADPWGGLVGTDEWMKGRIWFGHRHSLNPDANDMIVPFAIFAADAEGKFTIDRTKYYMIDEFDRLYAGKLHESHVWPRWVALLDVLSPKVKEAFAGTFDLHQEESRIDELAATYNQLRVDAPTKLND